MLKFNIWLIKIFFLGSGYPLENNKSHMYTFSWNILVITFIGVVKSLGFLCFLVEFFVMLCQGASETKCLKKDHIRGLDYFARWSMVITETRPADVLSARFDF